MTSNLGAATVLALALLLAINISSSSAALQLGFYKGKCNGTDVEAAIRSAVAARFFKDPTIVAALLRMQFHDCFVRGCDASILISGPGTEKTAPPNLSVRGYDLIDQVKASLEKVCPGVVSCSDIIIAATRDAVVLGGGKRYEVQMGRRDGNISVASAALANLPAADIPVRQAISMFASKGLSTTDFVLLMGGHTVGITHCSVISSRLYNYNKTGKADPAMDPALLAALKARCPQKSTADNSVNLDQLTPSKVDNGFYNQIMKRRGVLPIDQTIALSTMTNATVKSLATGAVDFPTMFGNAMVKLGAIQVLTGTQGHIRKVCSVKG